MRKSQRLQRGLVCGLAGWIVSIGMTHWGGPMARHLPDEWLHAAAFWGALVAGCILAGGFGRAGRSGWAIAAISACFATLLGAGIAGATFGFFAAFQPGGGIALSLIAIADGAESYWLLATWIVAMMGVDAYARWVNVDPVKSLHDLFK